MVKSTAVPSAPQIPQTWAELPPQIRARLEREGINSAASWRAAGARRKQIFGIATPLVRRLDELARQ